MRGAVLCDLIGEAEVELRATATIAATGVFADRLRGMLGAAPRLRPLRGSHLVLPDWRLPLSQAVAFEHPHDGRPVFAYPWQGRSLVGTTDLDHDRSLDDEPAISPAEAGISGRGSSLSVSVFAHQQRRRYRDVRRRATGDRRRLRRSVARKPRPRGYGTNAASRRSPAEN